jgi:hypothetical protein
VCLVEPIGGILRTCAEAWSNTSHGNRCASHAGSATFRYINQPISCPCRRLTLCWVASPALSTRATVQVCGDGRPAGQVVAGLVVEARRVGGYRWATGKSCGQQMGFHFHRSAGRWMLEGSAMAPRGGPWTDGAVEPPAETSTPSYSLQTMRSSSSSSLVLKLADTSLCTMKLLDVCLSYQG